MNVLIENQQIEEITCGSNFSYVLQANNTFMSTEYKVLQSQANSCFVKCMRMLYNGKIQLFYLTKAYKPLSWLIPQLDSDGFLTIVANLFSNIIEVKHNGFLSCQKIDISFNHIYVEPSTYKVALIYVPLSSNIYDDELSFENEIRTELIKLISGVSSLSSPKTIQFASDLSNGTLQIEDLFSKIKGGSVPPSNGPDKIEHEKHMESKRVRIVAMNAPERVVIDVTKDEFVIGKKLDRCDGVVSFNDKISRVHCKISKRGVQYYVTDLQSANGTYVNGSRIQPNQEQLLHNGDVIRMANSDFQVTLL